LEPPRELAKVSLPVYRIEPPDVVQLEVLKLVPLPPYRIESLDVLQVSCSGTLPEQPINGYFLVDAEGNVDLGAGYGSLRVAGMTISEARKSIETNLQKVLKVPEVSLQLARSSSVQSVSGNFLVASDGTINLRQYGLVRVSGMTLNEAQVAIERRLSAFFDAPKVSLDVVAYNSKVYYIVTEGAGMGDNIVRVPVTGNETVLDALSQVRGLSQLSSKKIWIARPAPYEFQCEQILPVDYEAVTRGASVATNFQIMPGDRLFIAEDRNTALANFLGKVISPFERVAGFAGLTSSTIRNFRNINTVNSGGY
jgi:polysaccharide export outer membrane protein